MVPTFARSDDFFWVWPKADPKEYFHHNLKFLFEEQDNGGEKGTVNSLMSNSN